MAEAWDRDEFSPCPLSRPALRARFFSCSRVHPFPTRTRKLPEPARKFSRWRKKPVCRQGLFACEGACRSRPLCGLGLKKRRSAGQIRLRDSVLPGELIFVPYCPKKTQERRARN
jgi:hypothetical protein